MNYDDIKKELTAPEPDITKKTDKPQVIEYRESEDTVKVEKATAAEIEVSKTPALTEKSATGIAAKQLASMIYAGMSKADALKTLGIPEGSVSERELSIAANEALIHNHYFPNDVRRAMVRAALNKTLTDAVLAGDADTVIKAAKEIASDPDVGLKAPPQQVVNIALGDLTEAMKKAEEREEFNFND